MLDLTDGHSSESVTLHVSEIHSNYSSTPSHFKLLDQERNMTKVTNTVANKKYTGISKSFRTGCVEWEL